MRIAGLFNAQSGAGRRVAVFATALLLACTSIGIGASAPAQGAERQFRSSVDQEVPDPRFTVGVTGPWIQGFDFAPNATVTITKNDDAIHFDESITTEQDGQFWLDSPVDFAAGDRVAVFDGVVTETLVISPLVVDAIDKTTDTFIGHATPGAEVHLWVDDTEVNQIATADATTGAWRIDVAFDLGLGSSGGVEEYDANGNGTLLDWNIPNPTINADPVFDSIHGDQFGADVVVTVLAKTGEDRTWSGQAISYEEGWFDVGLVDDPGHPWDLKAGDTVTVRGSNGIKEIVIADLEYTGYDLHGNTVSGSTDRAGTISVDVEKGDEEAPGVQIDVESGVWVVDFNHATPGYQLQEFDRVWIAQFDADWDSTAIGLRTLAPTRFVFSPVIQDVVGSDWPRGEDVRLTIERPSTSKSPDFESLPTPVGMDCHDRDTCPSPYMPVSGDANVFFNLSIGTFQARAGDIMTMSNGTLTKSLTVPDISVGLGEESVLFTDDDADQAWVPAPQPDLAMDPQANRVWISDLPTAGSVKVTIRRGGTTVHRLTVNTRNVFTRGEWLLDMWTQPTGNEARPAVAMFDLGDFDLQGGDDVTVNYGANKTMTKTVANLTVDSIDADTDTASGTAEQTVALHLGEGEGGWWGYEATPDATGDWSFFFDASVFPWQGLALGMPGEAIIDHNTIVFWTVGDVNDTNVMVIADDQMIDFGATLPPLTWKASDPDATWLTEPKCATTAKKHSPVGTYPISCTGAAAGGYMVDYRDGVLTIARAAQTIDFETLADRTVGTPPVVLHATTSSGLPVSFETTTPTVCTITGKKLDRLTMVEPGECSVAAGQAGDDNHLAAPSVSQTIMVRAPIATVAVTSDLATAAFGQAVKITATVTATAGKPAGMVTFVDGPDVLGSLPLKNGEAVLTIKTLAVGSHDISVGYDGGGTYSGSTGTLAGGLSVTQAASKSTITNAAELAKKSSRLGVAYVINVRVVAVAHGSGIPTGTVDVTDGTTMCSDILAANGTVSCTFTPTAEGAVTITASYIGDGAFSGSTATATHAIARR